MKIIHSKIFRILVSLFILGFILGIISYIILEDGVIESNIINYFDLIKNGDFNYIGGLIKSLISNYKYLIIIWISGILMIGVFISPLIVIFRGIFNGFLFTSIILCYGIKGLLFVLILLFPCIIINELIYILTSYYCINFSLKEYNALKNDKSINIKSFSKNYFYILLIFLFVLLISSLIEIFISSNLIKFVV